jgi:hypothetical protein
MLNLSIVGGPQQSIIRPARIEDHLFADSLQQMAQFGSNRLLDVSEGTERAVKGDALVLKQETGALVSVSEKAELLVIAPLGPTRRQSRMGAMDASSVLFEEDVVAGLRSGLEFGNKLFDDLDPTQRLSHIAVAAKVTGADYRAWRTRAEHQANPNGVQVGMDRSKERDALAVDFPRPSLRLNRNTISEDLAVRLSRQFRSG